MCIGMFLALTPFLVTAWCESQIQLGLTPHISWQLLAYLLLSIAEVMLVITVMEFSYTQAPKRMKSLVMSFFYLSISAGNVFTAVVNQIIQNPDGSSKLEEPCIIIFAGFMGTAAVLFAFIWRAMIWTLLFMMRRVMTAEAKTVQQSEASARAKNDSNGNRTLQSDAGASGTYPLCGRARAHASGWGKNIDYMCLWSLILGYDNEVIEQAVRAAGPADTCLSGDGRFSGNVRGFDTLGGLGNFCEKGADATNMAVLIARTHSGRRKLIAIEGGYHGSSPWMQARGRAGISERDHHELIRIPWNDLPALQLALLEHPGEVAAFISSPYHHPVYEDNALPDSGYWKGARNFARASGAINL